MIIRVSQLKLPLDWDSARLPEYAARALRIPASDILLVQIAKKSVDARSKSDVHFSFTLDVTVKHAPSALPQNARLIAPEPPRPAPATRALSHRPLVVGLGPAGLFAARTLAMRGYRPIVIERGKPVDARARDVAAFWKSSALDIDSNVQFGEGGAGAFSDGKLTTGIKDARCRDVLRAFFEAGAPEEILYAAKPHIGTDRLRAVVKNLREQIVAHGGEVHFNCRLQEICVESGRVIGARVVENGVLREIDTRDILLAIGHSARDTFEMLHRLGVVMRPKPFSIGVRIEHSQRMIDVSQYGASAGHPALGAAEYKLAAHLPGGRSVYSFCMCPGGYVVASSSEAGGVVTNGMSRHARDGENANSALLVSVDPSDFGADDPLAGVRFQRAWERAAFALGGSDYRAPAQLVGDFINNQPSTGAGGVSPTYRPGVAWARLDDCLPAFATDALKSALPIFDRRIRGFAAPDAVLTGVETRSSSPIRIERDARRMSATRGLYPCGEGAGHAGGILSAAVDGIRCAEALIQIHTEE
ncbi:MAG: NAD(P)/FAD-dependent oxidoreductase [Christensenellales bacterium]|jgi:uncharacterized FAD-dependent dehydrogenase